MQDGFSYTGVLLPLRARLTLSFIVLFTPVFLEK